MRNPRINKTYRLDLTKPINTDDMATGEYDCFGKEWDMSSKECPLCADRDICGILFKDKVDKKTKDIERKGKAKFLDNADFDSLTDKSITDFIDSGVTTSKELIEFGIRKTNCDDVVAVKNKVKEFVKKSNKISIKKGTVWMI